MKGRERRRGVSCESPRNTLDEPQACELEARFVKVSSFQTYLVTWALASHFTSSAPHLYKYADCNTYLTGSRRKWNELTYISTWPMVGAQ